ncbi:MAG: L-threonylcarbamoyladenylate synthase [Myxococcota bacterium]|nr:L-threonylcarbamoyladenylate synthase [Myxococcota bacterium]
MSALPLEAAVDHLAASGLLAFPTETVWGLGADASSDAAVSRLLAWKGRDADKPLSVLVPDLAAAIALGAVFDESARRLAEAFWPGPLTLVVPFEGRLAPGVVSAAGSLGLRCSPDPTAGALARRLRDRGLGPLTATSLNKSGEPAASERAEALRIAAGDAWLRVVGEGEAGGQAPSSVLDCTGGRPALIREGAIAASRIDLLLDARSCQRPTRSPIP